MNDTENRPRWYDARDVTAAARGRWADVLARFGVNTALLRNAHGPCPGCGGKDRFRFDDEDGTGSFICSQGGGGNLAGGGIGLLMHITGWEWKRAVNEVGAALGIEPRFGSRRPEDEAAERMNVGVAAEPSAPRGPARPEIDMGCVAEFTRGTPEIDFTWLRQHSPLSVEALESGAFLNALYGAGERVIVCTDERSQGNFLWQVPEPELDGFSGADKLAGGWRLSQERGTRAVKSALPGSGRTGVWFLVQPVTGKWEVKGDVKWSGEEGHRERDVQGKWTRRSAVNVTNWRYLVLESDELPPETWLRVLVNFPLPIAALYTSGGRSIHALLKLNAKSKAEWDAIRDSLQKIVCPLGADGGALSGVRLSRLPGCHREGAMQKGGGYVRYPKPRLQELLYLDPNPDGKALRHKLEQR